MMLAFLIVPFMLFLTRNSVEKVYGITELGYFSAFTMVIAVFSVMKDAVYLVLLPVISEKYIKHLKSDIIRIILVVLGIIIVATLLSVLLARLIGNLVFSFVFGVEILGYMYLLLPVIITGAVLLASSFSYVCLTAMQKRVPILIGMLAGAALLSVFVIPATRSGGMLGTTYIFAISLCVIVVIHGFFIFRYLRRI
jgi:O-antigen/teichoic acid export membrane protein